MKIVKTEHLNSMSIYQLCNRENLYTRGTVEQYNNLLMNMIPVEGIYSPSNNEIYNIALDIAYHSYEIVKEDDIENIMQLVAKCVEVSFEIRKDSDCDD